MMRGDEQSVPHHTFSISINPCRPPRHAERTHFPLRQKRGSGARRTLTIAQRPRCQNPRHKVWPFKPCMSLVGRRVLLPPRRMCVFFVSTQWTAQGSPFFNSVVDTNSIEYVSTICSRTGNTDLVSSVKKDPCRASRESHDLVYEKTS